MLSSADLRFSKNFLPFLMESVSYPGHSARHLLPSLTRLKDYAKIFYHNTSIISRNTGFYFTEECTMTVCLHVQYVIDKHARWCYSAAKVEPFASILVTQNSSYPLWWHLCSACCCLMAYAALNQAYTKPFESVFEEIFKHHSNWVDFLT